jgi:hypothetical protein
MQCKGEIIGNSNRWETMLFVVAWVETVPGEELLFQAMMATINDF